jgi:hypothetical protein
MDPKSGSTFGSDALERYRNRAEYTFKDLPTFSVMAGPVPAIPMR